MIVHYQYLERAQHLFSARSPGNGTACERA
jgi:hypothetical protein